MSDPIILSDKADLLDEIAELRAFKRMAAPLLLRLALEECHPSENDANQRYYVQDALNDHFAGYDDERMSHCKSKFTVGDIRAARRLVFEC